MTMKKVLRSETPLKFWIVWNDMTDKPPVIRHFYRDKAIKEAERLAENNPGLKFIVCESVDRRHKLAKGLKTKKMAYEEPKP